MIRARPAAERGPHLGVERQPPAAYSARMLRPVRDIIPHIFDGEDLLMPEGKIESEDEAQRIDWYANVLREHSPEEIQDTIAKALSDLTGEPLNVSIMRLDFAPKWAGLNAETAQSSECVLRIRPAPDDDSPF